MRVTVCARAAHSHVHTAVWGTRYCTTAVCPASSIQQRAVVDIRDCVRHVCELGRREVTVRPWEHPKKRCVSGRRGEGNVWERAHANGHVCVRQDYSHGLWNVSAVRGAAGGERQA